MLILTVALTKKTTARYINPTKEALDEAKGLHAFLDNIHVTQLEEGFSFHVEFARDEEKKLYSDIYMQVTSQYTMGSDKFLSNGGLSVNIQPLIDFLAKIVKDNS